MGEISILSNGEVYTTLSVDPSASVRDALKNPTFNIKTVEFALFNTEVGIKKEKIIVYEIRTHY